MNKNGFIATSLIYSFFLIFVTLFLTIIADYLQDKVLLNTIEKGIKDEINNTMSIEDFEVGDMVFFDNNPGTENIFSEWVVAKVDYIGQKLILYSHDTTGNFPNDDSCEKFTYSRRELYYDDFENDIDFGYKNATYYNKIIYSFSSSSDKNNYLLSKNGSVSDKYYVSNKCDICKNSTGEICTRGDSGCTCNVENDQDKLNDGIYDFGKNSCISKNISDRATDFRFRIEIVLGSSNLKKVDTTGTGTIYLNCNE